MKRKAFLQNTSLFAGSLMVPRFLKAWENPILETKGQKVVVIIQLSGGNDGLNTVIPVRNDIYYRERPLIAIKPADAISLNTEAALHPALPVFKTLYDEGFLSVINSVGYPNPDRSHFRSMDIWQSASDSREYLYTGWLGRYLDAMCPHCDLPSQVLELDDTLSLALKGVQHKGIAFKDPDKLYNSTKDPFIRELSASHQSTEFTHKVDYLYKTMASTVSTAGYIFEHSRLKPSRFTYPATGLGQRLKSVAGLINSNINTRVYYVSLGSFDTHAGQPNQQQRLFTELNDAVEAFTDDLKMQNRFDDVLLFTFSEFGRRVSQNASNGTDHGTANNMFFISGALKQPGIYNPMPDLNDLDNGDLRYTIDFRDVYATVLNHWLNSDDQKILSKKSVYLKLI